MSSSKIKEIFHAAFDLEWDSAAPEDIHAAILSGARVKGTNMCILILAIFIASIGLNMNSTAVIIGAMLISPLMGGIMAIGYGIATNNLTLSRNAFLGLAFQVFICIVTSTLYFSLTPISTAHSELLARTTPTIWDVLIAVFGGLAGIIGLTRREKTNVIPGVAIATALMPPLCTAGYGLATHNLSYFTGAMYLFFINSFFICLSTIVVVRLMRLPCKEFIDGKARRKLHLTIAGIAVITVLPSIYLAYQIVGKSIFESNVSNFLSREFSFQDTQMVQSKVSQEKKEIEVALLGKRLSDEKISEIEHTLPNYSLSDMRLRVTQTEVAAGVSAEDIQAIIEKELDGNAVQLNQMNQAQEMEDLKAELTKYKARLLEYQSYDYDVESITRELKALYPQIDGISIGTQKSWDSVQEQTVVSTVAVLSLPEYLVPAQHRQITDWLVTKTQSDTVVLLQDVPRNALDEIPPVEEPGGEGDENPQAFLLP